MVSKKEKGSLPFPFFCVFAKAGLSDMLARGDARGGCQGGDESWCVVKRENVLISC